MTQCGRVEPVIEVFRVFRFVGMAEPEKFGLKDWKRCSSESLEGKSLCAKHGASPIKFKIGENTTPDGKVIETFVPFDEAMIENLGKK